MFIKEMEGDHMDSPIRLLEHTDEATKQMLENVRKRKKKFDDAKKLHNYWIMATLFIAFMCLNYFYFTIARLSSSFFAMFSVAVNDLVNVLLVGFNHFNVWNHEYTKTTKGQKGKRIP